MEFKISKEIAEESFKLFEDYYEVGLSDFPEDQAKAYDIAKNKVVKAIRIGRMEITISKDGTLVIKQNLKSPLGEVGAIEYGEITGKAKLAMKSKGETDYHGRIYAMMGSLSSLGESAISSLKGADSSLVEALGILFLQV